MMVSDEEAQTAERGAVPPGFRVLRMSDLAGNNGSDPTGNGGGEGEPH